MTISGIGGGASFAQAQQRFERADANGNGTLNREEFDSAAKNAPGNLIKSGDDAFAKLDANGDGELTKGEIRDGVRAALEANGLRPGGGFSPPAGGLAAGGTGTLMDLLFPTEDDSSSSSETTTAEQTSTNFLDISA